MLSKPDVATSPAGIPRAEVSACALPLSFATAKQSQICQHPPSVRLGSSRVQPDPDLGLERPHTRRAQMSRRPIPTIHARRPCGHAIQAAPSATFDVTGCETSAKSWDAAGAARYGSNIVLRIGNL